MRTLICLSALAFCSFATAVQAEVILGLEYRQLVGGSADPFKSYFTVANFAAPAWEVPQIQVTDVGKTFVASADTVGDYATLDWGLISTQLLGSSYNFNTFYTTNNSFPVKKIFNFHFQTATMTELGMQQGDFDTFFIPSDMYFASIDRVELNVTSMSFEGNQLFNGVLTWRIYGEPSSVPEPTTAMFMLTFSVGLASLRRR